MNKQIAGALVASLLIGSAPGWAAGENAASKPTVEQGAQPRQLRDSIDRALDGQPVQGTSGQLTARERGDLETRRAILQTDPVARGAGGIAMFLVGTAASIGLTVYLLNKAKKETTPMPSMGRP